MSLSIDDINRLQAENEQLKEDIKDIAKILSRLGEPSVDMDIAFEYQELKEENEKLKRQFQIESLTSTETGKTVYRSKLLLDLQTNCTGCEAYTNMSNKLSIKNRDSRIYKNTLEKVFEILSSQVWQIGDDVVVEEARRIIREVLK